DRRLHLPFINQSWPRADENKARINGRGRLCSFVNVEENFTHGELAGSHRLPTSLRAFDEHRTGGGQPPLELAIEHTRRIGQYSSVSLIHPTDCSDFTRQIVAISPDR